MNGAACLALARLLIGVERLVQRRQIFHQVLDFHFDAVNQRLALEAIPFEPIEFVRPRRFQLRLPEVSVSASQDPVRTRRGLLLIPDRVAGASSAPDRMLSPPRNNFAKQPPPIRNGPDSAI